MICIHCGAELRAGAKFCGKCGRPIGGDDSQYTVYTYDELMARANKAYGSLGQAIPFAIIATLVTLPIAVLLSILSDDNMAWFWVGIPLTTIGLVGTAIIWAVKKRPYMYASQQAIVRDNRTNTYYVAQFLASQINGWDAASRVGAMAYNMRQQSIEAEKAQSQQNSIDMVEDHIHNRNQPTTADRLLWGVEKKATELKDMRVESKTQKATVVSYTNAKGKRKRMIIPNAYPGFEIS